MERNKKIIKKQRQLSNLQIVAIGYFSVAMIGTMLLMLPISSVEKQTTFTQAFFTSISASCVTGLAVVDTGLHWTFFGQLVILALIQIGGMGFMTIGVQFMVLLRRKVSLKEREIMVESMNATQIGGILGLAQKIVKWTMCIEGIGALLLATRFIPEFGFFKGIFFSIFHSISAFCNAGFDLMGQKEAFSSMVWYANDMVVNFTLSALITIGGIGFIVWQDVDQHRFNFKKYTLHSKIVICMSALLSFGGGILFFWLEADNMAYVSLQERVLVSFFHSISCRTAGFNTIDMGNLSAGGSLLTMILMFIGGSSGSTAGGIKTSTMAVVLIYTWGSIRGKKNTAIFGRRLELEALYKSTSIISINLLFVFGGTLIITAIQPTFRLADVLIEIISAMGTAGLTTGITRELAPLSTYIIALLMFLGRVGSVSVAGALMEKKAPPPVMMPKEKILVG